MVIVRKASGVKPGMQQALPMNLLIADCGLRIADCVLRHGSWPLSRSERNSELSMNRLVTCNWRFGEARPEGDPVLNFQLPVTSYQLPVTSLSGSWSQIAVNKPWKLSTK